MGKRKPALRFKGFDEEWTPHIFGDLVILNSGRDYKHLSEGNIPVYGTGGYMLSVNEALSQEKDAIGIGRKGTINNPYILRAPFWTVDTLYYAIPKINQDIYFIYSLFKKINWKQKDESTGVPSLSKETINNTITFTTAIHEQEIIGNCIKCLETLITQQQRKYDTLLNVKKSMLEKMFPKEGTDVPEIRFKGFEGVWIRSKLSDVLVNRRILQRKSDDAPRLAFASGQGVIDLSERKTNNRDQLISDESTKYYLLTEYNDIVYNPANLKYGAIDRNKHGRGVISPIYVTFTTEEIPSFIERIVTSERFKLKALLFEEGTVVKRQSVSPENLLSFEEMIAPSKDEQKKIGDYFDHLDTLINFHRQKLDHLKHIKSALLEKMFVQEAA